MTGMESETLTFTLPKDVAEMLRHEVEAGTYASSSELVYEALRTWDELRRARAERLETVRARIREAADDPRRLSDEEVARHFAELAQRAAHARGDAA